MKSLKTFEEFTRDGVIRRIASNRARAESLAGESARKMRSLKQRIEKLGVDDDNANDYVEYCYDIIMHMVRAIMLIDGFYATGPGAHEAEVSYLTTLEYTGTDVAFADQLRYFRNGILYYGTSLDAEYAEKVIAFTNRMYPRLQDAVQLQPQRRLSCERSDKYITNTIYKQ